MGDQLIADHPEIATYLRRKAPARKVKMITYGAESVTSAPIDTPESYGLKPGKYFTLIARPIPENSILQIVEVFSRAERGYELVVLGDFSPETDPYHRAVVRAASTEVRFLGGVYDPARVQALRFHSLAYLHGHTVGGTNPSLVEAMGAGNPIIAHDNAYNRWVAQGSAQYFTTSTDLDAALTQLIESPEVAARFRSEARARHAAEFTWEHVAGQYEDLLLTLLPRNSWESKATPGRDRS